MAAGSSPPPVASEKTSEGCRTAAANASPSSGALSPSTISTRRRSPRAGPSVISLSPTAAMASRRKRLARPSRTSPPHEARPIGPEDELPGAGLRGRRGRRQRVRLALAGRALLAPYLLALHVEDRRLGGLLHLDPGARLRTRVDHVRDLAPAPIEEAQIGEVGPAGGEHLRRDLQAREPGRRGHEDGRLLREEPAQVGVGPLLRAGRKGDEAEQRDQHAPAPHVPSAEGLRKTKRWYASETAISDTASPSSDATR